MIYKFKSSAAGDVIMLEPQGTQMLRLIGKEAAPKGIIEPADMAAAIGALQAAIGAAEAPAADTNDDTADEARSIGLRQRLWPMVEMLRRAQAANAPVVWGV